MKATDKAWAAGIIDGEGSIMIALDKEVATGKNRRKESCKCRVSVGMCHEGTVKHLHDLFGFGYLSSAKKRSNPKASPSYVWETRSRQAETVLKTVRPYLITKAKEADVALEFLGLPRKIDAGGRSDPAILAANLAIHQRGVALRNKLRRLKSTWTTRFSYLAR